ncbi:MAG: caspase family protein [Gemmatimonadales bacterium]
MAAPGRFHVLLIGIDAYGGAVQELDGCVNDIDAIQRILLDRAGISPDEITRLVSAHPDTEHEATVPEQPATNDNIRAALEALGSSRVKAADRVFIYFAGHGGRLEVVDGDLTAHRESLLPVDCGSWQEGPFIFDYELNGLLARIAERTSAVTVVLDCCQSAGITRNLTAEPMKPRFADLGQDRPLAMPAVPAAVRTRGLASPLVAGVDRCQVVTACLNHEVAQEEGAPGPDGQKHGLLTRAMMAALGELDQGSIRDLPWGRVWHRMKDQVETANPGQHLWMSGDLGRAVLGGPPVDGDFGLAITRLDGDRYRIEAGTLAGVTVGARIAVYGESPAWFPTIGTREDLEARYTPVLLEVTEASRSDAVAEADGEPFDLPDGARGRLVEAGEAARMPVALVPRNAALAAAIAKSALLELVPAKRAAVRLEQSPDGSWNLGDDVHGAAAGTWPLVTLRGAQLDQVGPLLEQYVRYSLPFRLARQCTDLPGALDVRFVDGAARAAGADARELPRQRDGRYRLVPGTTFTVRVNNTSGHRLRVVLLAAEASGNVAWLGDQIIDARSSYEFWLMNTVGQPFNASLPSGVTRTIDRLVAIGTTEVGRDLKYLASDSTFADALVKNRKLSGSPGPPVEQWTATEIVVQTGG